MGAKQSIILILRDKFSTAVERTAINHLSRCLRKLGYQPQIKTCDGPKSPYLLHNSIILTKEGENLSLGKPAFNSLGEEGFILQTTRNPRTSKKFLCTIGGATDKALLYGVYNLTEIMEKAGKIPLGLNIISKPYFKIREWETMAFQANFNLPLGGAFDRPIEELKSSVERIIKEAPKYGINCLHLTGRAGEEGIDIDWLIPYKSFPKIFKYYKIDYGRQKRLEVIRELADKARQYGLKFIVWNHEFVYPSGLLEEYPELKGKDFPICFSKPFILEFLQAKIDEFFQSAPEIDGINLTFAETRGFNIFAHKGCQCKRCLAYSPAEKIHNIVITISKICKRYDKLLEVRTYNQSPRQTKIATQALKNIPEDVIIMSKYTPLDFRGVDYPDNPLIGVFKNNPQIVEFTLTPECNGFGFLPALLGNFYKQRINYAKERNQAGIVGRLDYHLQFSHAYFFTKGKPVLTFDTPNCFNIFCFSKLAWDPKLGMEDLWDEWVSKRYGKRVARYLIPCLKRTKDITQGIFYVKGFYLLSHLDMIPALSYAENQLDASETGCNFLGKFFPQNRTYQKTHAQLSKPDERVIEECAKEKDKAVRLSLKSIRELKKIKDLLSLKDFFELKEAFEKSAESAKLWKYITLIFFRDRMIKQSQRQSQKDLDKLNQALQGFILQALHMEKLFGQTWPVYNAARGITAYNFVWEICPYYLQKVTRSVGDIERLWYAIMEQAKPHSKKICSYLNIQLPPQIKKIRFERNNMLIEGDDDTFRLPTGIHLSGDTLYEKKPYQLRFRKKKGEVLIESAFKSITMQSEKE